MSEDLIPYFGTNGRVTNIDRENENLRLDKVVYQDLNAKQKESYNFQKLSSVLADYGYTTYRMFDDYNGADLHAVRISGEVVKIQLKGRLTIDRKYLNKQLYIAFSDNGNFKAAACPFLDIFRHVFCKISMVFSSGCFAAKGSK